MDDGSRGSPRIRSTALAAGAGMEYDLAIGDQGELWAWQSQEYDLEKDLLAAPSSSLWDASNNVDGGWNMFDEQTPIKHCTDFEFQFSETGEIVKDFEGGKETFQAKRRRMLQFCPENAEMTCSITEVGLSESLQEMDFSGTDCLLNTDGTDELPEEWLVNCPEDVEPCLPAEEIRNSPAAATVNAVPISVYPNSSPREQSIVVHNNPAQARPTPLKAGKNIIGSKKVRCSVAFPFELIKPCSIQGAVTLNDINKKIHAPPPYKIRHKSDEEPNSLHASAISGKPVVRKTKIHTDGGKGSITITTTRG